MKIFYKTVFLFAIFVFPAHGDEDRVYTIDNVTSISVDSLAPGGPYTLFEIYDVYEKSDTINTQAVYQGFVDSVYLASFTPGKSRESDRLVFGFVWEGEDKYIKPGFYLVPSGRKFAIGDKAETLAKP